MNDNTRIIQRSKGKINKSEFRVSKLNYEFDVWDDVWVIDGSTTIRFKNLPKLTKLTEIGFRKTLSRYAEEQSAAHTRNMFDRMIAFLKGADTGSISLKDISNYRQSLDSNNEYKLGALKGFILSWYEWGFEGVNDDVVKYLEELKLRGNPKGKAVLNSCPYSGAYTDNEFGAIIEWASSAFSKGKLGLSNFALLMILVFTGRRMIQIRSLRCSDIKSIQHEYLTEYFIDFPRAKKRGGYFRDEFKRLDVNEDLYVIISGQAESSFQLLENKFGLRLTDKEKKNVPVFIEKDRLDDVLSLAEFFAVQDKMPDYFHCIPSSVMSALGTIGRLNEARSERTGEYIHISSRRFRYTKGTNLSRRGISGVALAAALDHSDTQHISHYVQHSAEVSEQISELMAPLMAQMAQMAQAFSGTLISSERDAIRANDPHSRIKNNSSKSIGNCGSYAFCISGYRACYTCTSFQPWVEAPHAEVLDEILSERKLQEEAGVSSYVIQSTDRLLFAIHQVIAMCDEHKGKVET